MSRFLSFLGIFCTSFYIIGLWSLFGGRFDEIVLMSPNNIGDFLAGVFGPIAILWLILGFFQQGIELRQNTRALELQAEELSNSVEQQRNLVDVSRKQMEAELETIRFEREKQIAAARPRFVFHGVGGTFSGGKGKYSSTVKNLGNIATDVSFSFKPEIQSYTLTRIFSWSHGEDRRLEWCYLTNQAEEKLELSVSYIDSLGTPGVQKFQFIPIKNKEQDHIMVEITPL